MQYRNTITGYGFIARLLHWGMAFAIFGLFALGYWMRTLSYYSPYYKTSVEIHESLGLVVFFALIVRVLWKITNSSPKDHKSSLIEQYGSLITHWGFYAFLIGIMFSGYFISTLDGRPISFFHLVDVPSLYSGKGLEKLAGQFHWILAYLVIILAVFHTFAALWHHFIKRDQILIRMIKSPSNLKHNLSKSRTHQ